MRKYSKSSAFYVNTKRDFFVSNSSLLQQARRLNEIYKQQPRRVNCKLCANPLSDVCDFVSHGIPYIFCSNCGHLNGYHDDTERFFRDTYTAEGGQRYSKQYIDPQYSERTKNIYEPKVEFLLESLPSASSLRLLDVGCGSGYFVHACLLKGMEAAGIDVNETMVEVGNRQLQHLRGVSPLKYTSEEEFYELIVNSDASILSAIGVLEHLRVPQTFFSAFKASRIKNLFYSVPMFSVSAILENIFDSVFPRQLSGGHTHLFTENSVAWLHKQEQLVSVAEWRFGTDIMDLYRSILVKLAEKGASPRLVSAFTEGFEKHIDQLQGVLDQNHFCSEIHVVVRKA